MEEWLKELKNIYIMKYLKAIKKWIRAIPIYLESFS